jgi:hypothetical protein
MRHSLISSVNCSRLPIRCRKASSVVPMLRNYSIKNAKTLKSRNDDKQLQSANPGRREYIVSVLMLKGQAVNICFETRRNGVVR